MTALITYEAQVAFARRHIKAGNIYCCGAWRGGRAWGIKWCGLIDGFTVSLETIGVGPHMRAGSFFVRAVGMEGVK